MRKCPVLQKKQNSDKIFVAISKIDGQKFYDIENKGGHITTYIREKLKINVPSLYVRKKYEEKNREKWWEQWFDIVEEYKPTKKCKYCDWETFDIDNKTGAYKIHLEKMHGVSINEHLEKYPEDNDYFKKQYKLLEKRENLKNKDNYVICPICGEKFSKITNTHIEKTHNMEFNKFIKDYPNIQLCSNNAKRQIINAQKKSNLTISKERFVSHFEKEIGDFLKKKGIEYMPNRQILIGKELDIYIPTKQVAIEFDGLKWHTEWFGKKKHNYHLDKTLKCNEKGIGLIHIFEDEYVNTPSIVFSKIKHILNIREDSDIKIMARNTIIKEITKYEAETFLNENHIQGFSASSVYYGSFYNETLIAVMSFKDGNIKNPNWELTRYATKQGYICTGVGGKLFKHFIREYHPNEVYSFADRRWTINIFDNLYTKIGFKLDKINKPDYKYYNENIDRYKRLHKMFFNKQKLNKKYGFPLTMTEKEMAKELGYDRIWDCGLIKYVWKEKRD